MSPLRLGLLGGFRAEVEGKKLLLPKKSQGLLAYLVMSVGEMQSRAKLAGLLWGDTGEEQARNSLRQALFVIRKSLVGTGLDGLVIDSDAVAVRPGIVDVDVDRFGRLVAQRTRVSLEQATELYRGDLLDGFHLREAPFESWLVAERERLRRLALAALRDLLEGQRRDGATDAAIGTAVRLLTLDPLQEAIHRTLMRLYAAQGNRPAALKQYELCAQVLHHELGVQPESETKAVYQELLAHRLSSGPSRSVAEVRSGGRDADLLEIPPLIARDAELASLLAEIRRVRAGACRVVAVLGEAGVGKTRLLEEAQAEARQEGVALARGQAHPSEQVLPFGLWVSALRDMGAAAQPTLLDGLAPMWHQELGRLFPELRRRGRALSLGSENRMRLYEAVGQLVGQLAAHQPLMMVLEDVHWADPTSIQLVSFLARRLENHPLCLALSARPEEIETQPVLRAVLAELEGDKRLTLLSLAPLSRADTFNLTRALLAPTAPLGVARIGEDVWRLSEGNPFVVLEAVRTVQEGTPRTSPGSASAPDRVRRLVADRLDHLEEPARQLVSAASVLGKAFELDVLRRIVESDEHQTVSGVEELVHRRLLRVVGDRLDFTHERIREIAYHELPPDRRRLLHAAAAAAMEQRYAADLDPHLAGLAGHWREGEIWDKAVHYHRLAADQALSRAAYIEARRLLDDALKLVPRLPETDRDDVELDVRLRLRVLTKLVGEGEHLGEHLDESERLARSLGDDHRLAFVLSEKSHIAWLRADQTRAREMGQRVLEIGRELGEPAVEGFGHRLVGKAHLGHGACRPAVEHLERAIELLPDDGQPDFGLGDARSGTQNWLAIALCFVGRFDDAYRIIDRVIATSTGRNDHRQLAWATCLSGFVRTERGDVADAIALLERATHVCATWQITAVTPWCAQHLARACAMAGRHAQALRLLERFTPRPMLFGARVALVKGEAYLAAEMLDDALTMAETSIALARQLGERPQEACSLRLAGDVHARLGLSADAAAEACYRQSIAIAEEFGNLPEMARARLGLGLLLRRSGRQEADPLLDTARAMLTEMRMTYWLARLPAR